METQHVEVCDCYIGVDRMINEGGGHLNLYYDYDLKNESKQAPTEHKSKKLGDEK